MFFQVYFVKSEIGHYFCPFFSFPKKSWKKIREIYIINDPTYLKEKKSPHPYFLQYFLHISIAGDKPLFDYHGDIIRLQG